MAPSAGPSPGENMPGLPTASDPLPVLLAASVYFKPDKASPSEVSFLVSFQRGHLWPSPDPPDAMGAQGLLSAQGWRTKNRPQPPRKFRLFEQNVSAGNWVFPSGTQPRGADHDLARWARTAGEVPRELGTCFETVGSRGIRASGSKAPSPAHWPSGH